MWSRLKIRKKKKKRPVCLLLLLWLDCWKSGLGRLTELELSHRCTMVIKAKGFAVNRQVRLNHTSEIHKCSPNPLLWRLRSFSSQETISGRMTECTQCPKRLEEIHQLDTDAPTDSAQFLLDKAEQPAIHPSPPLHKTPSSQVRKMTHWLIQIHTRTKESSLFIL